jgi:hypothetical protein
MPCHHNFDEYLVAYLDGADPDQIKGNWNERTHEKV